MAEKKKKRPPLTRACTEVNENTLKALGQCRHPSLYKKNHTKPASGPESAVTSGLRRIERARSSVKGPRPGMNDPYMDLGPSNLSRHRSCPHLLDEDDSGDGGGVDGGAGIKVDIEEYRRPFDSLDEDHKQQIGFTTALAPDRTSAAAAARREFGMGRDPFYSNQKVSDTYGDWPGDDHGRQRENKKPFGEPPFSAKVHSSSSCMSPTEGMFRFDRISTSVSDHFSDIDEPDSDLLLEERVSDSEDVEVSSGREGDSKCNQWLQGLQLSQTDRLKSRSHLRLPPV
ncbi:unnamed protein product [Acanthosepion pharaonis]|uniref:Uncharacterized protein n=1 Tax=Acanthosepion pharaonis TaxID=158019 RepID=A0A812D436_ACAPH|nr:unnamed protein product [Sepia pharaonis]